MTGTDLVQRTQETVALIDHPQFLEQVEALLPEDVPLRRFTQVAKTAIRTNPDLVAADQNSLFAAIIRCAQDGLYPDKHEAVLNVYKGKVTYLPMVHGVIRAARDYGWLMHAEAVYENDEFEWRGSDTKPLHRHPRPGEERGDLVAAFAYATHGEDTVSVVLYDGDIKKRRAKAQTQNVWTEWPEAMYRKSVAHALYRTLPRSERDRVDRFADDTDPAEAATLLYGPNGSLFREIAAAPTESAEPPSPSTRDEGPGTGGDCQQATSAARQDADVVPGAPDEEDPEPAIQIGATDEELRAAAEVVADTEIPNGAYAGMTLRKVAAVGDDGHGWLEWALRNSGRFEDDFYAALETFVHGFLPDLWEQHVQRQAA